MTLWKVAKLLNVSRQHLLQLINNGKLKAERNSKGNYEIDIETFEELEKQFNIENIADYYTIEEVMQMLNMTKRQVTYKIEKGEFEKIIYKTKTYIKKDCVDVLKGGE